jgi:hypothetical protein
MSLNKFSNVNTGYEIKLDGGFDEVKCNTLDTQSLSLAGYQVADYQQIVSNYTATNGATIATPLQSLGAFNSGKYLRLCDNVSVTMDNTNTFNSFAIEFDVPGYVPATGVQKQFANGSGGRINPSPLAYSVIKKDSSYVQGSGRLSIIFTKVDGTLFSSGDTLNLAWDVVLVLP